MNNQPKVQFRPCGECPDLVFCEFIHDNGRPAKCAHVKARAAQRAVEPKLPPSHPTPLTLPEACDIVMRHWEEHGSRGFPAAIELLKRVRARA